VPQAASASCPGYRVRKSTIVLCAAVALAGTFFFSSLNGAARIGAGDVLFALFHPRSNLIDVRILWEVRMPRIFCGLLVGAALGMAGSALQTLVRNPIVDPYITGVSAGASVSAAIGIALGVQAAFIPAAGTVTGLLTAFVVMSLSLRAGRIDSGRLILAGIFISAFLSAIVSIILLRLHSFGAAQTILAWLAGSLAGHGWSDLLVALPYVAVGGTLIACAADGLNAMRLGEERAASVGAPIVRTQWLVVLGATLLTAAAVSLSGIVGFVGLLAPHAARRFVGSDARWSIPLSALCGAMLVTLADLVARTIALPSEIPIGALLSLFGVPALFLILRRERRLVVERAATFGVWRRILRVGRTSA
jgi:iron complex transport system permease protein